MPLAMHLSDGRRDRAVAQSASRRFPTTVAGVRVRVRSCSICGRQSHTGAGFLRIFRFPLPNIPPTAPHSSTYIIRGWYNRPVVASVIVDSVPLHRKRKKKNTKEKRSVCQDLGDMTTGIRSPQPVTRGKLTTDLHLEAK
jgi:hypothetical protein